MDKGGKKETEKENVLKIKIINMDVRNLWQRK
jgi:hypothetical protein